ncbi:MAG: B12-binding domain-containing radical SAM protein [Nitrospinales bacterium]
MNIKIIEPFDFNSRYDIRSLTPALGPVVIATLLQQNGHDANVVSEYVTRFEPEDLDGADLVGISITTYNAKKGFDIAQKIDKPVVFGGFHASLMPEECLAYGDYVIRGDGHTILELVEFQQNKEKFDISDISNLVYKKNGKIFYNRMATKAINIIPDFNLVKNYYKPNLNRLLRIPLLVNASRGCIGDCSFCSIIEIFKDFKKKDKHLIVEDIQSQLKNQLFLSRFFPQLIWITDDNFFSDKKWAKGLLKEFAKIRTSYEFIMQVRVDIAYDDELLELLKKANFTRLAVGIETISSKSLQDFNKGFSMEDTEYAVRKIHSYGMEIIGLFVFGDDGFKKGDGAQVAEFVKKHRLSGVLIQPLTPFPGTELFKQLKKEDRILHTDWQDYNGKVVFMPKNLSPTELQEEIYRCYRKVFSASHVFRYLLFGKKGWKFQVLSEAILRRLEWLKSKKYAKDKLSKFNKQTETRIDALTD